MRQQLLAHLIIATIAIDKVTRKTDVGNGLVNGYKAVILARIQRIRDTFPIIPPRIPLPQPQPPIGGLAAEMMAPVGNGDTEHNEAHEESLILSDEDFNLLEQLVLNPAFDQEF